MYEPKWDGFRSIVFADGDELELASRNERPLTRYFPELVSSRAGEPAGALRSSTARSSCPTLTAVACDFEALLQRIHPAASRVRLLAEQTPASFVAFDLLALGDEDCTGLPFERRRALLEEALAKAAPPVYLTPDHAGPERGGRLVRVSSRVRGSTAWWPSRWPVTYEPDKRVMFKIKHERTADCVVAGYRLHKSGPDAIGSLLLGLYDDAGNLASVGVDRRVPDGACARQLFTEVQPLGDDVRGPSVELGRRAGRGVPGPAPAVGRGQPVERAEGPVVRAAAARAGASRSGTSTWKGPGSGTRPSGSGGAMTATRARAASGSSRSR